MSQFVDGTKLDFDDVLICPKRSIVASRSGVKLERTFQFFHSNGAWTGFPLMISNMFCTGTREMANALGHKHSSITCLHKFYSNSELDEWFDPTIDVNGIREAYSWMSMGSREEDIEKLEKLVSLECIPNICLDVANGYSETFTKTCNRVRNIIGPSPILMAGNVCTPDMVKELIIHGGVDIVKVGIGPGQFCETRKVTGVGYPQLSAILECADAAHGLKSEDKRLGLICADGGCKTSGDICKAFGAGADFVMVGTMVAGTDECIGEWENHELPWWNDGQHYSLEQIKRLTKKKRLKFYGMSSDHAQLTHYGSKVPYAASEGKEGWVDYKGPVENIINEIKGGIRSCCSYIGATNLKEMAKCTTFVRVS